MAAVARMEVRQQSALMLPDQKMLLCLFVGLAATAYGIWRDVAKGSTRSLIGLTFVRIERPTAF